MQKFYHQRALTMLGALILYFFLWPICCCAAKPTWSPQSLSHDKDASSNQSANDKFVDLIQAATGSYSDKASNMNAYEIIESATDELTTTTSIHELFDLREGKRKSKANSQILSRTDRSVHLNSSNSRNNSVSGAKRVRNNKPRPSKLDRNERSANLSHITGSARKIQLYIKNRFLQLLPDGTVNGTTDDVSDLTILQRTTVNVGQIKIQGVATCLFLCMNACGTTYGSAEFTDDCIFNESMEQHHYNTYSSTHHSNAKRTLYLGLNRHGQPRKIQLPTTRQLGKLATYTKSLTQTVAQERVEQLISRLYGSNHVRHGLKQLCDTGKVLPGIIAKGLKAKPKCNNLGKQNKKKKKKRKCRDDEAEGDHCVKAAFSINGQQLNSMRANQSISNTNSKKKPPGSQHNQQKKCGANEECKVNKKKPTKRNNQTKTTPNNHNNGNKPKVRKKPTRLATTTPKAIDEVEHDLGKDEAFTSDEMDDDDDYDELNASSAGHSNLIEDLELDDYIN